MSLSGWGRDESGGIANSWLHGAEVEIFRDRDCGSMKNQMTNDMICAGYKAGKLRILFSQFVAQGFLCLIYYFKEPTLILGWYL